MSRFKTLLFLCLLPALAALGHDLYLYFMHENETLKFVDMGVLWSTYSPDTFKTINDILPDEYQEVFTQIMMEKAAIVLAVLGVALAIIISILRTILSGELFQAFKSKNKKQKSDKFKRFD